MDCNQSGSSVCGILQARILEGLSCCPPGDLPDPGIEPTSPALAFPEPLGKQSNLCQLQSVRAKAALHTALWPCKHSSGLQQRMKIRLSDFIMLHGLPWWLSGKESACNTGATGDTDSIPGSGRSPGGEHGNLLQYSCLENPTDREAWWARVHRVTKSWTQLK